jgi:hypothetical protein
VVCNWAYSGLQNSAKQLVRTLVTSCLPPWRQCLYIGGYICAKFH